MTLFDLDYEDLLTEDMAMPDKRHDLSSIWGDRSEDDYSSFIADMEANGVLEPVIWTLDGMVLDGWHRYRAATDLGIASQLIFKPYSGESPISFVVSRNAERRHLTASQKAACVVRCRDSYKAGMPKAKSLPDASESSDDLAKTPNVGPSATFSGTAKSNAELAAEEAGLGDRVASVEMSAKAAATQARRGDELKSPTRMQRLAAHVDSLEFELRLAKERNEDLQARVRFIRSQTGSTLEREEEFTRQRETNRGLQSSINQWQGKYSDLEARHRGAIRQIRELEAQLKDGGALPSSRVSDGRDRC